MANREGRALRETGRVEAVCSGLTELLLAVTNNEEQLFVTQKVMVVESEGVVLIENAAVGVISFRNFQQV